MTDKKREFYADFTLFVVAVIWGATFLPVKVALYTNDVFTILFWRFLISFIFMATISAFFVKKIDKNSIKYGVIVGVFLFAGFGFQTFALKSFNSEPVNSSVVAFITGLYVVFVPFVMALFFSSKIRIYSYIGAFLSAFGLYLISNTEFGFGRSEILSLICALAYTFQIIFTGEFVKKCEIYTFVCVQFLVVAIFSLLCAILFENYAVPILDKPFIIAVLTTSVFCTVFAFFAQSIAQKYTTAVKAALIFTFETVSAGVIGYFFGEEVFNIYQIFGAFIILIGILISELGPYIKIRSN